MFFNVRPDVGRKFIPRSPRIYKTQSPVTPAMFRVRYTVVEMAFASSRIIAIPAEEYAIRVARTLTES